MTDNGFASLDLHTRYDSLGDPLNAFYVPVLERAAAYDHAYDATSPATRSYAAALPKTST